MLLMIEWLFGSKTGRSILLGLVGSLACGILYFSVYSSGKHACQEAAVENTVREGVTRNEIDDFVASRPASVNRKLLQRWSR